MTVTLQIFNIFGFKLTITFVFQFQQFVFTRVRQYGTVSQVFVDSHKWRKYRVWTGLRQMAWMVNVMSLISRDCKNGWTCV